MKEYSDQRIILIKNRTNIGLVGTLNKGFSIAQGKYIARMDQDDISLPRRLEDQVSFLEANPDVGICGTGIIIKGWLSNEMRTFPIDDASIKAKLLFCSPFAHPTVMIRKAILENGVDTYNPEFCYAEDYALWFRYSRCTKFANLKSCMLEYRIHSSNISIVFQREQKRKSWEIQKKMLGKFGFFFSDEQLDIHSSMTLGNYERSQLSLEEIESWLLTLKEINEKTQSYSIPEFNKILTEQWYEMCCGMTNLGLWVWKKFWRSPMGQSIRLPLKRRIKFFLACLIKFNSNHP